MIFFFFLPRGRGDENECFFFFFFEYFLSYDTTNTKQVFHRKWLTMSWHLQAREYENQTKKQFISNYLNLTFIS